MGITISGENNNDRILASDGVIDQLSGFNVVGVMTATSFTGDLTGDVTGNLTGNVTGNINNTTLLLQTGGTERVRITSAGKVGINEVNPTEMLHIKAEDNTDSFGGIIVYANNNSVYTKHGWRGLDSNEAVRFAISGTEKMRLTNGGKLALGRTSADEMIHITHDDNTDGFGGIKIAANNNSVYVKYGWRGIDGSADLRFGVAGSERLRITSGGKIGVNYTSTPPGETIHIQEPSGASVAGVTISHVSGGNRYGARLQSISGGNRGIILSTLFNSSYDQAFRIDNNRSFYFYNGAAAWNRIVRDNASHYTGIAIQESNATQRMQFGVAGTSNDIITGSAQHDVCLKAYDANLILATNATERLRIKSDGKVRFGSGSPAYTFEIRNSGNIEFLLGSTNAGGASIIFDGDANGDGGGGDYSQIFHDTSGDMNYRARGGSGASNHIFLTGTAEKLRINASGQVSVGTATPQTNAKLQVVGNIGATQFYTTGTSLPQTDFTSSIASNKAGLLLHRSSETNGDYGGLEFHNHPSSITSYRKGGIYFQTNGSGFGRGDIVICNDGAGDANNLTIGDEKMRIISNGRVHIKPTGSTFYAMNSQSTNLVIGDGGGGVGMTFLTAGAADNQTISFQCNESLSRAEGEISYGPTATSVANDRNAMMFRTNSAERMRISKDGKIGLNNTSPAYTLDVAYSGGNASNAAVSRFRQTFNNQGDDHTCFIVRHAAALSGQNGVGLLFQNNGGTAVGKIDFGQSTTQYRTSSDYRLKENAVSISDGISRLKTLKPYRFNWIAEKDQPKVDGFFAHEVTAVPESISGTKDEVDSDNNPVYQSMDHSKLVPLLTAALQEEISKRESLEARVATLESS